MLEWLKKAKLIHEAKLTFAYCEVCKARILLKTTDKYYIKEFKTICREICCHESYNDRVQAILTLVILSIFLVVEAIVIAMNLTDNEINDSIMVVAAVGNSLLLTICFIYVLVRYVLGVKK